MRRARGKTAKRGKNPENYSTSAKIARISRTNSIAFERALLTSHSCLIRARALRRARDLWDMYNVTEDADLGYRLARDGYRIGVIGPPTYEEAPVTFGAWLSQRTRWIKGHLQTWLVLMRNPTHTAREMGFASFIAMQLTFATGILAAFIHGPLAFILLTALLTPYDLLTTADLILALLGYSVAMFASLIACGLSNTFSHARAALTMPLYWPLATVAAYRAFFELIFLPHYWSKTKHGVSARTAHKPESAASLENKKARAA